MTAPLTVTELDAATKAELQPPCEATISHWHDVTVDPAPFRVDRCGEPADVMLTVRCERCRSVHEVLLCDDHSAAGIAGGANHGTDACDGALRVISAVWL